MIINCNYYVLHTYQHFFTLNLFISHGLSSFIFTRHLHFYDRINETNSRIEFLTKKIKFENIEFPSKFFVKISPTIKQIDSRHNINFSYRCVIHEELGFFLLSQKSFFEELLLMVQLQSCDEKLFIWNDSCENPSLFMNNSAMRMQKI